MHKAVGKNSHNSYLLKAMFYSLNYNTAGKSWNVYTNSFTSFVVHPQVQYCKQRHLKSKTEIYFPPVFIYSEQNGLPSSNMSSCIILWQARVLISLNDTFLWLQMLFCHHLLWKNLVIIVKYELLITRKIFWLSNSLITSSIKINTNEQKTSLQENQGNAFLYH